MVSEASKQESDEKDTTDESASVVEEGEVAKNEDAETTENEEKEALTGRERLVYTLSDEEIEAFDDQLAVCRKKMEQSESYEVVEAEIEKLYEQAMDIQEQITIAEILYYCHMDDRKAMLNHLQGTEIMSELILKYNDLLLEIYEGDEEEYKQFFDDWSEADMKLLTGQTPEYMRLEVANAELLTEFYALGESELVEKVGALYSEFVQNGNLIGAEYGYDNYYDYATDMVYRRDYGEAERKRYRAYVKQYIVPLYNVVALQYEKRFYDLSLSEGDKLMDLLFEKEADLSTDYLESYFAALPGRVQEGMRHMFERENYIMTDAEDAYAGAFTADLEEPFCYFGPDSQDLFVIVHELGHYYADLYTEEQETHFDLAETQSQGNEMLCLSFLEEQLPEKVYEALIYYELYNFMNVILQATILDEFEETVYKLEDVSGYQTTDYDRLMYEIAVSYAVDDPYDIIPEGMSWLWQNVGMESPVYYLSYAVSATAALNLYSDSTRDFETAVESYRVLLEEVDEDAGFCNMLEKSGLTGIFEEETYIKLLGVLPK